jgi:hypothetical protein
MLLMVKVKATIFIIVLSFLLGGCTGIVDQEVYAPIPPTLETKIAGQVPYEIHEGGNAISFDFGDVKLYVYKVALSEKLIMVIGPAVILPTPTAETVIFDENLMIAVAITVRRGTVSINPPNFVVMLDESNLLHRPKSIKTFYWKDTPNGKEYVSQEVTGVVTLGNTNNKKEWQSFEVTYDIPKVNLSPFVFHLGELRINESVIRIPEIIFERRSD